MKRPRRKLLAALLTSALLLLFWELLPFLLAGCLPWERPLLRDSRLDAVHPLQPAPETSPDDPRLLTLCSLGHCTVLVSQDGHTLVTDPVLVPRLGGAFRRWNKAPGLDQIPSSLDAVLITHFHADHCSPWTLARLDRHATLIGPRGARRRLGPLFPNTVELEPWQSASVACWRITAVPSWHPSGRNPARTYDPATTLGYVIQGPGPTLYVSGDTEAGPHFREIARRFPIDLALINVSLHLPGPQARQAAEDLHAPVWIPLHWGAYPLFDGLPSQKQLARLRNELVPAGRMVWLRPRDSAHFLAPRAHDSPYNPPVP